MWPVITRDPGGTRGSRHCPGGTGTHGSMWISEIHIPDTFILNLVQRGWQGSMNIFLRLTISCWFRKVRASLSPLLYYFYLCGLTLCDLVSFIWPLSWSLLNLLPPTQGHTGLCESIFRSAHSLWPCVWPLSWSLLTWHSSLPHSAGPWPDTQHRGIPTLARIKDFWTQQIRRLVSVWKIWMFQKCGIFQFSPRQAFHVMILKDVRKVLFHQDYETFSRLMEFMTCLHEAFPHVKCICGWRGKCFKLWWKYCFSHWESLCS